MTPLSDMDRRIINALQNGFPLSDRPFAEAGAALGMSEQALIEAIARLVETGRASRFAPLWNSEELGGAVCLAAMAVPPGRFEEVCALVNAHAEIAHNYEREHTLNMWFVASSVEPDGIAAVFRAIEAETGLRVWPMPKEEEFFVGFRVEV